MRSENEYIAQEIKKKWLLVKLLAPLELKMIRNVDDPKELFDKLKGNLGTIAVVGALFGSASLGSFNSGAGDTKMLAGTTFALGFVRVCAAGAGLCAAILSALIVTMMNSVPVSGIRKWAVENVMFLPFPTLLLFGSLAMTAADLLITAKIMYTESLQIVVACLEAAFIVFFFAVGAYLLCFSSNPAKK
jgi:hypothetical protein